MEGLLDRPDKLRTEQLTGRGPQPSVRARRMPQVFVERTWMLMHRKQDAPRKDSIPNRLDSSPETRGELSDEQVQAGRREAARSHVIEVFRTRKELRRRHAPIDLDMEPARH